MINQNDHQMLDRMKRDILECRPGHSGSILNSGFKRIPSVEKFDLSSTVINSLLKQIGLKRKLPRRIDYKVMKRQNQLNRYMEYQVSRLIKMRDANRWGEYWKIVLHLIKNSTAFRVSAYNRVFPSWYRTMPLYEVYGLNKEIHRIITTWDESLKYRRVYIDKPGKDTFRPLGVPENAWRVVMHMWNNFITLAFRPQLMKFNHGFMPGMGTTTAWKEMINKVIDRKYIYEFDLKQFFPGVSQDKVLECLQRIEFPNKALEWLGSVNTTLVDLPREHKLDESLEADSWHNTLEGLQMFADILKEEINMPNFLENLAAEEGLKDKYELAKYFHKEVWSNSEGGKLRGLPQGLNTSPILSIITLIDWYKELENRNIKVLMYADDGLLYSDKDFDPYFDPLVQPHPEKSGWVKREGTWKKVLVFLGLLYNPQTDELEGHTRKGSYLKFGRLQKSIPDFLREIQGVSSLKPGTSLKWLAESNLMGLVQARLYTGSWIEGSGKDHPWEIAKFSWWGLKTMTHKEKGSSTLSSTAVGTLIKIIWGAMNRQKARYFKEVIYRSKNQIF